MSAHTPGPWFWDGQTWGYDKENEAPWLLGGAVDPVISGADIVCRKANARLIAAAPDLLEALNALTHALGRGDLMHDDQRSAYDAALAAITKATT